jgi:phage replication O-like protein O
MANPQKENGHLDLANELVEQLAQTQLSSYETRILWVIFRKTYSWHKKEDWISLSQFKEATKINHISHISRALKLLQMRNIITKGGNKYGFNKDYEKWVNLPKGVNTHHLPKGVIDLPKGVQNLPKGAYTKETKQKKLMTKEITPIGVTVKQYGNPQINECISFLKESLGGSPDGSQKENRRFCKLLLDKFKKDYPEEDNVYQIKFLIEVAKRDSFHAKNATSFKYLYYNAQKIVQSARYQSKKPTVAKIK